MLYTDGPLRYKYGGDTGKAISPLLNEWFAYLIVVDGPDVVVKNKAGEKIDTLSLHLRIQADTIRQRVLYDTAMSLWR